MVTNRDIIDTLNCLLRDREWSVNRLANEANISQSTINSMLHSSKEYFPSLPTLNKICDALGLTAVEFWGMIEQQSTSELSLEDQRVVSEVQKLTPLQRKKLLEFLEAFHK